LLANVYLHYVFDLWIEAWRQKVATGDVIVVRYADDLVVGFENRMEAERFLKAFRERLAKFGLELHPEKTRLIEFGRVRCPRSGEAWSGEAGDLHVPGLYASLREAPEQRVVHRLAENGAMATKGCERLLPLPCSPGQPRPVECLRATLAATVASPSTPSQSTTNVVEPDNPDLQAVDSSPTRFASLSYRSLPRHSSKVGAVCVKAPVRICAGGGDQRWSSLPRQLGKKHEE